MHTTIEISKSAILHNLQQLRKKIGKKVLLMPVLKSNAYGHGIELLAKICERTPLVDRAAVVSLDEALSLRRFGFKKPILILAIYENDKTTLTEGVKKNITFPVFTLEQAASLSAAAKGLGKKVQIHLKIDTGTSRIGILTKDALVFVKTVLKKYPLLQIEGIFSHFSSSEENDQVTREQFTAFNRVIEELAGEGVRIPTRHIACSAATVLHDYTHVSAVRVGINVYGLHPSPNTKEKLDVKPVLSMNTKIIQVKEIPKNTAISYGRTYTTTKPSKIAVLPVGYWDGYDRGLSNKGEVLIRGIRCPVRGRVCMNLTVIDVTHISDVKAGEKVTLIGANGKEEITVDELAEDLGTINYEIVTRLNPLIPRKLVK